MKGALADPSALYQTRLQQHLYPSTTYANVSGGDPPFITDLTHEALVAFHAKNYHPSNARIYTFGDFDVNKAMELVEAKTNSFGKVERTGIKDVVKWTQPRKVVVKGPVDASIFFN